MRTIGMVAALGAVLLAGCAQPGSVAGPPERSAVDEQLVPDGYDGRFRTWATVLESPDHGPQLCHYVQTSYPPQCGGPDIAGWDWAAVPAESAAGTTWGGYLLVGTFDGTTFILTEPAVVDDGTSPRPPDAEPDYTAPCPEPAGGWKVVDPNRAGQHDTTAVAEQAARDPDFAGSWVDQRGRTDNDPTSLIYVVRTTGDPAAVEADLREVWGGSLCVVGGARFTEAELLDIHGDLSGEPGVIGAGVDVLGNRVELTVYVATAARQRTLDERYGVGVVLQRGVLEPLD